MPDVRRSRRVGKHREPWECGGRKLTRRQRLPAAVPVISPLVHPSGPTKLNPLLVVAAAGVIGYFGIV
jgi:hypothetical protein